MPQPSIGSDIRQPLEICRQIAAQITLDLDPQGLDLVAKLAFVGLREILDARS
jgi:hypothetical protein